jgi:hypothetical protein
VRTTGRHLLRDLPIEYAKRVKAEAALASASWHNDMLALAEAIILNHAGALTSRRRQLNLSANHGRDDSRWLQDVESFIDEIIEASGCQVRSSPELLQAVRWMIASATAQFASPTVPFALDSDSAVVEDAA